MSYKKYEEEVNFIKESKQRCKKLGMDPNIPKISKDIMTEVDLVRKKEEYGEVLEVVNFFSTKIIKSLEGTPILIGVSDECGYLLDTMGDKTIEAAMLNFGIKQGVRFSEEEAGTNVVSLAIKQNHPVQLIGSNHYHTHLHNSACYGVPFHYSDDNNLLGCICIMTSITLHNPFFLMMLTTVVDAIERELLLRKQSRKITEQKELLYKSEKKQREILERDLVMKDEFIAIITHEFKTPISVIHSAIQLIEHVHINKISNPVKKLIESIKRNTFRQLRLVNNLLDITRLNAQQFKLNFRNIDIVYLTEMITESVKIYSDQKKIKINFKSDISSINTAMDYEKYERIILNLLSNAIKFTPEGGSITVTVEENIDNKTVEISVTDTGIGIPKEKHNMIFQRFGQVDSKLSRQAEGSGIGLALVKMLANTLDGDIKVDSKVHVGSTFTVILPIKGELIYEDKETFIDTDKRLINSINVEFSDIYF